MSIKPEKTVSHSGAMITFLASSFKERFLWDFYFGALRPPKVRGSVQFDDPALHQELVSQLKDNGVSVKEFQIDVDDYKAYMEKARYQDFSSYRIAGGGGAKNFVEKTLEHYVASKLLGFGKDDVYIDVGSADSPVPEIYRKLYGCKTFRQDIMFPHGVRGGNIGGDACAMPLKDGFASKIGLHCAFEHFEGNSDVKFVREASRILQVGGKMVILPLYLFKAYAVQTNPAYMPRGGIPFERDAMLYCIRNKASRHQRFYDVPHFMSRIIRFSNAFETTIYAVVNQKDVDPSCYLSFAAVFEKKN
jgi:hypothetical protein